MVGRWLRVAQLMGPLADLLSRAREIPGEPARRAVSTVNGVLSLCERPFRKIRLVAASARPPVAISGRVAERELADARGKHVSGPLALGFPSTGARNVRGLSGVDPAFSRRVAHGRARYNWDALAGSGELLRRARALQGAVGPREPLELHPGHDPFLHQGEQ